MTGSDGQGLGTRRYLYVGWAVVETMLFGGIVNGWASLVFVLKQEGLYADLCNSDAETVTAGNDTAQNGSVLYTTTTVSSKTFNESTEAFGMEMKVLTE
jgi:LAT3 family solute carrier family 43 protein 3